MKQIHYESMYRVELNHWWYRVRRKFVHDLINKHVKKESQINILDVGCGGGALMKELEIYGHVDGVDFSQTAVDFCKSRGIKSVSISGIESLPFDSNNFDLVLALDVLEHIPNDKMGVNEVLRVLKPGGVFIAFVPAFMSLWGVTDERSEHYRRYRLGQLTSLFSSDFTILKRTYFNTFLFVLIALTRILSKIFKINIQDENSMGGSFLNKIFYYIFNAERFFLNLLSFPFGISCCVVVRKKLD